ncbi:MAG: IS110 family transposase, partial [Desulfuromonadales bacterium]|nr:IS110 family transposase [Desulfuromonadales bacterium]
IGLDVHKEKILIALAFAGRSDPESHGKTSSDLDGFLKILRRIQEKYELKKEEVALCYEAGPTGFVLCRRLRDLGYECEVIAPSSIPKKSGDRIKTDRRDACKLARLFRAGELTGVHVPDRTDEIIRDVARARTDAVEARMRARQQLGGLLLRNGYNYTGKSAWSEAHMRYLREMVLPDRAQKLVLEEYLQRIDSSVATVERIEEQMKALLPTWPRRRFVEALQGFRGFQFVASMVITGELGDLMRFRHPRPLMAYLGLVPSEHSTGDRRRQGSITKSGNSHARWMLVEVAQHYRMPPKVSKELSKRQEGLSREIRDLSWRAQNRLHRRFHRLLLRGLHPNKAVVAVARELVGFIWELSRLLERDASNAPLHVGANPEPMARAG